MVTFLFFREDLVLIQHDIKQLSEEFSIKCLENASLEERLNAQTIALTENRKRISDLMSRNEELNIRLRHDIERLNRMVNNGSAGPLSPRSKDADPPEVSELKVWRIGCCCFFQIEKA